MTSHSDRARRRRPRGGGRTGRRSRRVASRGASRGASRSRRVARGGVTAAGSLDGEILRGGILEALVAAGARRVSGFKTREQRVIHVVAHLRTRRSESSRHVARERNGGLCFGKQNGNFVLGNKMGKNKLVGRRRGGSYLLARVPTRVLDGRAAPVYRAVHLLPGVQGLLPQLKVSGKL